MQTTSDNIPFAMVPLPAERSSKPRASGLTMMMDWGMAHRRVEDALDLSGPYVDLAKIVVGTARLYPADYLMRKLDIYKAHDVQPFLGGQFAEYVFATQGWQAMPGFFDEAVRLGFAAIEISDNCVPLEDEERIRLIKLAIKAGLDVHGEIGSKVALQPVDDLISQAKVCFEAGCGVVLVEAAEIVVDGKPQPDLISGLQREFDLSKIIFELNGPWIANTTPDQTYALKKFLIGEFGADVNLANVMPDDLVETEALRVGLSVVGPQV